MLEQKFIGVVQHVSTAAIEVLVDANIKSLKRDLGGKTYFIGQIGMYILIPMGNLVLIGMITDFLKVDVTINGQAQQRYKMTASLVGTVKGGRYERGVSIFPVVDSPVYLAEDDDLAVVESPTSTIRSLSLSSSVVSMSIMALPSSS